MDVVFTSGKSDLIMVYAMKDVVFDVHCPRDSWTAFQGADLQQ